MSDVRHFGALGDGRSDDTGSIRHAVDNGASVLFFSRGIYRITETIEVPLGKVGPFAISGDEGTSTVVMEGAGPAFRLVGSHGGTGDPGSVEPGVWLKERMPTVRGIVIEGAHPEADGFELVETMQALFEGVMVRRARHGIHLVKRNRNVIISHCHLYHNSGAGVYLDGVNLHQINITGSHISYNRLGGIRIERSEVRNLQITGNDIEYNNAASHETLPSEPSAEIWIDTTDEGASVNELTIASNTIQATESEGGANIRIREKRGRSRPPGLIAITGNVIGSQQNNVHLTGCHGVTLSGNTIYSCGHRNLLVEDSRLVTIGCNHFRRHTPQFGTGVRLDHCEDCAVTGCTIHDESEAGQESGASLLEMENCVRISVSGCHFLDGVPCGIDAGNCRGVRIANCIVAETREPKRAARAIRFRGNGSGNVAALNTLGGGIDAEPASGLTHHQNLG